MLTPEEIARLRELEAKATPGEWKADEDADISNLDDVCLLMTPMDNCNPIHDAHFIAAARNAMPALLDEIERLQAEREELTELLTKLEKLDIDIRSPEPFAEIAPEAMRRYLEGHGWKLRAEHGWVQIWGQLKLQITTLSDPTKPEYSLSVKRAVESLCEHEGRSQLTILCDLKGMK